MVCSGSRSGVLGLRSTELRAGVDAEHEKCEGTHGLMVMTSIVKTEIDAKDRMKDTRAEES